MPRAKAAKSHEKFPLFEHATGVWAKKHRGLLYYFTKDKSESLREYVNEWERRVAAKQTRRTRPEPVVPEPVEPETEAGLTVKDAMNLFLTHRKKVMGIGKLSIASWQHYLRTAGIIADTLGKSRLVTTLGPTDFTELYFELAKERTVVTNGLTRRVKYKQQTLNGIISRTRTIFLWLFSEEHIEKPIRFGTTFVQPTLTELEDERKLKQLTSEQVRTLIDSARGNLRAMILLGINCGYGQGDCSELSMRALETKPGWTVFPRPKTKVKRRCPLWPETVEAIMAATGERPKPHNEADAGLVFVNAFGKRYIRYGIGADNKPGTRTDGIGQEYMKLSKRLKVPTGFYRLRHTFRHVADNVKDPVAVNTIMGHRDASMGAIYRGDIEDERLVAVTEYIRRWLKLERTATSR